MTRLGPSDRIRLISDIGRAVQAAIKVADIPGYLRAFGVQADITGPVSSKWVLIRELLADESEETILAIARDLRVSVPGEVARGALDLARALSDRGMQVCQEDFARALETVEADPAQAIGHACTSFRASARPFWMHYRFPFRRTKP